MNKKWLYGFMAVLIFLQYLAPLPAIAEELTKVNEELTLSGLTVTGETEDTIELKLDGQAKNNQEVPIDKQLTVNGGAKLIVQNGTSSGTIAGAYSVTESGLQLSLPANTQGDFSLSFSIDRRSVASGESFVLTGNNQSVSTTLPIQEEISSSSSEEIESNTTQESTATSESSSTSEETSTSETQSTETSSSIPEKQARADGGNDIRTYFDGGTGTILSSADITYRDKNGNVITGSIPADATAVVHYDWLIPEEIRDQIQPNDHFIFHLPEGVKIALPHAGELINADGTVYGAYSVDSSGKVTMIFNDNVTDEFDIKGTFDFFTKFDSGVITTPGDKTITFPAEDDLPPVDVFIKPTTDTSIAKAGKFDKTPNPDSITWTVDINQAMNKLNDPIVTETWPDGVTLDKDSIKVYKLVMNLDGTINSVGETLTPDQYTIDANGNVTILGETSDAYRVEYVTDINDSKIPTAGGSVPFKNQASLSDKNDPTKIPAEATVTATYGKLIQKSRNSYDSTNQQFSWTIKYNYGEKDIAKADAVITDTMSDNMELIKDSLVIYPITFASNGSEIQQAPLPASAYTIEPNPNGSGFVIKFADDIDGAYKITYKTQVDGIVTGTTPVNNTVNVGTGEGSTGGGNATQQNIIKSLRSVDYTDSTADWRFVVNRNHYTMKNLTITDVFDPVPGMALARPDEGVGGNYELKITSSTGKVLTLGTDYELVVNNYDGSSDYGFDIKFINDYAETTESFTIDYTTKFDISVIDPRDPAKDHFHNKGTVNWVDENNDPHTSSDEKDFEPKPEFSYNAGKSGAYNAQTKTITWTLHTNLSENQLHNATLADPITGNQEYVPNSLKIYYGHTNPDGTVVKESDDLVNDQMVTIKQPNENNNTLFLQYPNNQKTYYIEFQTTLKDKVVNEAKTYENTATYVNDGVSRDVIGQVSIKNGGSHVQKTGAQDPDDPNYVLWNVTINPSLSTLSDVVVTDTPSNNQIVDQESIKLYGTTVAADGTVTVDHTNVLTEGTDYTVEVITDNATGNQQLVVKLVNEISTAYVMEYRSLISSSATGSTDKVSNQVSITGTGSEQVEDDTNNEVTVEIDHSSGSASGTKGKITLQKTTEDRVVMPGVHFELWNLDKTQLLREGDIDDSGLITFGNLKLGDYLLVETSTLPGYTIPDDLVAGRKITISQATSEERAVPLGVINETAKVYLTKTASDGTALAGAVFKLEQKVIDIWQPATGNSTFTTNAQGILEIEELVPGDYRLIETKAPAGYLLDATPIEFTVAKNAENQIPEVDLTMTNYQGSAKLLKESAAGQPLAGAQFNVVDSTGKIVNATPLVSDSSGIITAENLAPGSYNFVEVKAPDGYILNQQKYPFTVTSEAVGEPEIVDAGAATNYQGAAALVKTNQAGNALNGASFDVYDSNDVKITSTPLTSEADGTVKIDKLAPGTYYFKEVKAPDGYILNTQTYSFTVPESNDGELPVINVGEAVNYKGSAELTKVNSQGERLAGAEFSVFDENNQLIKAGLVSDEQGLVHIDELAPGRYYFKETKAPVDANGQEYVINDYPVFFTISASAEGEPEVLDTGDFQNFKGKISLTKKGEAAQTIAGAEFTIYRSNDQNEEVVERVVTIDENGEIDISNLRPGNYKIVETKAPIGYIINTQPIYFVIQEDSETEPVVDPVTVSNYQISIVAYKLDGDSNAPVRGLAGAEFVVLNGDGTPLDETQKIYDANGDEITETNKLTADENGRVYASGSTAGTFQLVETKAPEGYILDTTPVYFTVENQPGKPNAIELSLGDINNYKGRFAIKKVNEAGEILSGGTFHIENEAGETQTVTDILGNPVTELSANDKGLIIGGGLAPGTYTLVEDKAPEGYTINTTPLSFTIASEVSGELTTENGGIFNGEFVNYTGSAQLTKKSVDGQALANAQFNVLDSAGNIMNAAPLVSDSSGVVTIDNLAPGNYKFVEIKAPDGYILNQQEYPFTIAVAAVGEPEIVDVGDAINYQGSAVLEKHEQSGAGLAGAQFDVYNSNDTKITTAPLLSNEKGEVRIDSLAPGSYYFKEVKAPDGYILSTQTYTFTVPEENNGEFPVIEVGAAVNYKGSAELRKLNDQGVGLVGAEFSVYDANDRLIQTDLESDANGKVVIEGLAPGSYYFKEIKAPAGYILNTQTYTFTIPETNEGELSVIDVGEAVNYKGSAELTKVNNQGARLSGAEFSVYDENDQLVQATLASDANGEVTIDNLAPGSYYFKETKAPNGYILNTRTYDFTVAESNEGKPSVIKVGEAVNYKGSAELTKINGQGELLPGAEFSVYDENNQLIQAGLTSDNQGLVRIDDLVPGRYYFKETKAPVDDEGKDYVINDYPVFFTIPETAEGEPEVLDLGNFQNFKGKISLTKEGEAAQTIAGAEFTIYRADDQNQEVAERVVTVDESGEIDISNLRPGSYKIVETKAPIGYIINTQPIYFVIQEDSETEPVVDPVTVPNYQISIVAYKLDGDSNEPVRGLAGAEFVVLNGDGTPLDETQKIYDANGEEITENNKLTSDENGRVYASGTAAGTFQLVETKAPEGYILDTTPIFFTVENQAGKPENIQLSLGDINNYKGKFSIEKVNEEGKLLSGGVFHIENENGEKQTVTDLLGNPVTELSANDKGLIAGGGLAPGTYTLVEDEAPEGYIINTTPLSFTIASEVTGELTTENGGVFNGQFVNYTGSAQLIKVDDKNQPLSGAEFTMYDSTGTEIQTVISDSSGKVTVTDLAPGSYELRESKAPEGYQLSDKLVSFTVSKEASDKPMQLELGNYVNNKVPEVPKTPNTPNTPGTPPETPKGWLAMLNSQVNYLWIYAGIVVVLVTSGMLIKRSRKTRK